MTIIIPVLLTCPSCRREGRHHSTLSSNSIGFPRGDILRRLGHFDVACAAYANTEPVENRSFAPRIALANQRKSALVELILTD